MEETKLEEVFQEIGFTKNEASVYLALLGLGSTTTGPIIKKASISPGKVYIILDRLINKGIVTHTVKSGTKYFQSKEPTTLIEWFEEKEKDMAEKKKKLLNMMPTLQAKLDSSIYKKQVEIYEGFRAMKLLYDSILNNKNELFIIGSTSLVPQVLEDYLSRWHKVRIQKKIDTKIIYSKARKKYAKNREKMKYTEVKYLDLPLSPSWTTIFKDHVITVTLEGEMNITCFLIKDKNVANSQKDYFNLLWKQAKNK